MSSDMKDRIQFVTEDTEFNDSGFPITVTNIAYECWCNRKVLSTTKEFLSSGTNNSLVVVSFKVRNCNFIKNVNSLGYKIKHKDKLYNIVQFDDSSVEYVYFKGECING